MTGGARAFSLAVLHFAGLTACSAPDRTARIEPPAPVWAAGLSVDAAREAHRQAELRHHLRHLEAVKPRWLLDATARALSPERIARGDFAPWELHEAGRLLFEHEHTFADGLGSPFRRVHKGRSGGPETTSCGSCHWRGGPAGAGSLQDSSFVLGDGDTVSSADPRNPPSLQGAGAVELLAAEMSAELQSARDELLARARREGKEIEGKLSAKGISFGVLRAKPSGEIDASHLEGVDPDLVIKPFGWKGTFATLRSFVVESLQQHFGIQAEELVARHRSSPDPELLGGGADPEDPDGDGVRSELTEGQLTALVSFLAMQELPVVRPQEAWHGAEPAAPSLIAPTATVFADDWARGREVFASAGCSSCHVPKLILQSPVFRTRGERSGAVTEIDLSKHAESPRLERDPLADGYPVWLFSDLKRHDMGREAASRHVDHGVPREAYLTRRLWGLASSPPYFYDGHAPWLDHAISAHGGEASESRSKFNALSREDRGALRVYLLSLRRERRVMVP